LNAKSEIEPHSRLSINESIMPATTSNAAAARTARRRAGWTVVVADSFAEAEAETRAYWRAATPAERLNALEKLREPFYGKDQIGGRLQRFLEVVPAE
jgi:methenyltetrahydromethanopterin cyclohydrolase